jgi:excisionase family DNA binding protein
MKNDRPKSLPKFYTIDQIAECTESSERSVRRWIAAKLLIAHRINGLLRISDEDFSDFLDKHRDS